MGEQALTLHRSNRFQSTGMSRNETSGANVAVVTANFQPATATLAAVKSLHRSDYPYWCAIIVDKASDNSSFRCLDANLCVPQRSIKRGRDTVEPRTGGGQ
jgi:hypothetical protein